MRQIGTLPVESEVRRLADYLLTLEIPTKVLPESDGWSLWVVHEDQRVLAANELNAFVANANDPKYGDARSGAEAIRQEEVRKTREHLKNTKSLNGSWATTTSSARGRPVTAALLGLSLIVAAMTMIGSTNETFEVSLMLANPTLSPTGQELWGLGALQQGQIWRLITPIFIHFSAMHLLFNMTSLWQLGGLIERRKPTRIMLILSFVSAVVSNVGQVAWNGPGPFGGMSGVICALFGYVWITGRNDPSSGFRLSQNQVLYFLIFLALCASGRMGPIANAAHFSGLAVGMIFAACRV